MKRIVAVLLAVVASEAAQCVKNDVCVCDGNCQYLCDGSDECKDSDMYCEGDVCNVDCTGKDACKNNHLECTSNRCQIRCAGQDACKNLKEYDTACTSWTVTQTGQQAQATPASCLSSCYDSLGKLNNICDPSNASAHCKCANSNFNKPGVPYGLYCGPNTDSCKVICDGSKSCDNIHQKCSSEKCEQFCTGIESCKTGTYECDSDDCVISCTNHESCKALNLKCPTGSGKKCHIKCHGDKACIDMDSSHFSGSVTVECNPGSCHADLLALLSNTPVPTPAPTPVPTAASGCAHFIPRTTISQTYCDSVCYSTDAEAVMECNVNCVCDDCFDWVPKQPGLVTDLWCNLMCNNKNTQAATFCTPVCQCRNKVPATPAPTPVPTVSCGSGNTCQCTGSNDCGLLCDGLTECEGANLKCARGDCEVTCSGMEACLRGSIDCSLASECDIDCSGYLSCRYLKAIPVIAAKEVPTLAVTVNQLSGVSQPAINCGASADQCDIRCTGMLACEDVAMKCQSDDCKLRCSQTQSCQSVKHECKNGPCYAECTGYKGCKHAVFAWGSGDDAVLECSQTQSCANVDIECPKGKNCIVKCSGYESCLGMKLRCPDNMSNGKKCEIHCTHGRACAGMFKTTHLSGDITATCSGWQACETDLSSYVHTPNPDPVCNYWVPTDAGAWTGLTHALCDATCGSTGVLNDICTAANSVVQLCECGNSMSTNSPRPVPSTCEEWGPSSTLSVVPGATLPTIPAGWCDTVCGNPVTSNVCGTTLSICECVRQVPAATQCTAQSCTCTATDCLMQCDDYRECKDRSKECPASSSRCEFTCSGYESCMGGVSNCAGNTCDVTCSGYASCSGLPATSNALTCTSSTCSTTCSGVDACKGVSGRCDTTGSCDLKCTGRSGCADMQHTCTQGATGNLTCSGYRSCKDAAFRWSACGATTIKCTDIESCRGATFECPTGHNCVIMCDGEESCKDVTLKCPTSMPSGTVCEIQCTGVRSCLNVDKNKVSGAVTAKCTGHEACHADLSGAVPTTCVEYEAINNNSALDCNTLCTNPNTDVVCQDPAPVGVAQLCKCKVAATPKPTCAKWVPTSYGQSTGTSTATCGLWCVNPLTDSVCSIDGANQNNRICTTWKLTARGLQQVIPVAWCLASCYAPGTSVLHAACNPASGVHQHCECDDASIQPLCQCEVPTPAPTPAPNAPSRVSVLRRIFRTFLRRLLRWFNRSRFVDALLGLLTGLVNGCTVHWVCPARACNPLCPVTTAAKLARGCSRGYLVTGRASHILQEIDDSSYVEYDFDLASGTEDDVQTKLQSEIANAKTDNTSVLAEFAMENVTSEETEVEVSSSGDDSFAGWKIAVIVVCLVCFFICIVAVVIFCVLRTPNEVRGQESPKSEPYRDEDEEHVPDTDKNSPVGPPSAEKKSDTERKPWR